MSQAGRAYTLGEVHSTLEQSAIALRFIDRQGYAAARDACPVESDESVVDAICQKITTIDKELLAIVPSSAAEIALQAAVVLDADYEFITDDVRLVLNRIMGLARGTLS